MESIILEAYPLNRKELLISTHIVGIGKYIVGMLRGWIAMQLESIAWLMKNIIDKCLTLLIYGATFNQI